jgi:hypothetical protein
MSKHKPQKTKKQKNKKTKKKKVERIICIVLSSFLFLPCIFVTHFYKNGKVYKIVGVCEMKSAGNNYCML